MEIQANMAARLMSENVDGKRSGTAKASAGNADSAGTGAAGGARVALSDKARSLVALKHEVDGAPDVRQALVDDISQRIAAGTYDVKGQVVAHAMVRHAAFEAVA